MIDVSSPSSGIFTYDEVDSCCICVVVSVALGSADTPVGTGSTVVVVSGAVSSVNFDCNGGNVIVVNDTISSDNAG